MYKDSFCMAHSRGTCVLLEAQTLNKLTKYFQIQHTIFLVFYLILEVYILLTEAQNPCGDISQHSFTCQSYDHSNDIIYDGVQRASSILKSCCAVLFYSLCLSIVHVPRETSTIYSEQPNIRKLHTRKAKNAQRTKS